MAPEVGEAADEPADGLGLVTTLEVIDAEVAVCDAVPQDEVGRGEERGRNGDDRLLRSAPRLEAEELRAG